MKDKIIITIVCAFCIGMYWVSRTSSMTTANESFISKETVPYLSEDTTMDYIDFETPGSTLFDETELQLEISDMSSCSLSSINIDALTFSETFGYYRQCFGSNSSFHWKGREYTTLLSDEVIIQVVDSVNVDEKSKEREITQIH